MRSDDNVRTYQSDQGGKPSEIILSLGESTAHAGIDYSFIPAS